MTEAVKKKLPVQAVISIVTFLLGAFMTLSFHAIDAVKDYAQLKDDVKYVRVAVDTLQGVPENMRLMMSDIHWMRDSSFSQGAKIGALERIASNHEARLTRLEARPTLPDILILPPAPISSIDGTYTNRWSSR